MLEQQIVINLITTPIMSGVVGYATNYLAIKMLFRPYTPKWYTLGWQGLVPKSRKYLAKKFSEVVGQKLLAHDDFIYAIENSDIRNTLENIVSNRLEQLKPQSTIAFLRLIRFEDKIIENHEAINNSINSALKSIITSLLNKKVDLEFLRSSAHKISENINIESEIDIKIFNLLSKALNSTKNLEETLPHFILDQKGKIATYLTDVVMRKISSLSSDEKIMEVVKEKVIEGKNKFLESNPLLAMVGAFISDDKVKDIVDKNLPGILNNLSENQVVYNNIYNTIFDEINKILNKPINELTSKLGENIIYEIMGYIKSLMTTNFNINNLIKDFIDNSFTKITDKYKDKTINEILSDLNIDITKYINIDIRDVINSDNYPTTKRNLITSFITYLNTNSKNISGSITELLIKLIKNNLQYALKVLNIEKIVEDKVNDLPLPEVENILFAFMKKHFKWINILGFVIGFIVGLITAIVNNFMV